MGKLHVIGAAAVVPDQALIDCLRELLAEAEAGKLTAMFGVAEYRDGEQHTLQAGDTNWDAAAGALLRTAYELLWGDEDED